MLNYFIVDFKKRQKLKKNEENLKKND